MEAIESEEGISQLGSQDKDNHAESDFNVAEENSA